MEKKRSTSPKKDLWVHPAFVVLFCVAILTLLGLSILFSATAHSGSDPYFFIKRQVVWVGIALLAGLTVSLVPLEKSRPLAWVILGILLVGLILVLIPGIGIWVNGSRRWLPLGPMRLQVSEFAKLGLVFAMAVYLGANQRHIATFWRGFIVPSLIVGLITGLVILQPDYGMASLCAVVGFGMMFLAGTRLVFLIPTVTTLGSLFGLALYLSPVRWRRVMAFLDVEGNQLDSSYQLWQAMLAFGAGGIQGSGLGNGRQQMAFLPEAHTDFIFAVIGEELGLIFTGAVLALFLVIFLVGVLHLKRAPNLFQYLLIAGMLMLVTFQALINMAVVTGCIPTQGMSLPFISYGGSNLVVVFIIVGLIVNTAFSWSKSPLQGKKRSMREIAA
jgi:cell division protein FtsW